MTSSDLSSHGNTTDTVSNPIRVSRYADMGLNRPHPLAPYRTLDARSRDTTKATEQKTTPSLRMNNYLKTLDEEEAEDLEELEELMVPEELRLLSQQREASSTYGWQPINKTKTSRYTTGILTQSGWQLIDNPATANTPSEGMSTAHALTPQQGDILNEVGLVIEPLSDPVDGEENGENSDDVDDSPWLDDRSARPTYRSTAQMRLS